MNFLFESKYTYKVNETAEDFIAEIRSVVTKPWYNFSGYIAGAISEDGSFMLYPKITIAVINTFGKYQNIILTGKITTDNDRTIIRATLKPSFLLVLIFYLIFLIFLYQVYRAITSSEFEWIIKSIGLFIIMVALRIYIYIAKKLFLHRFERQFSMKHR